jgi:hypothetical protein
MGMHFSCLPPHYPDGFSAFSILPAFIPSSVKWK